MWSRLGTKHKLFRLTKFGRDHQSERGRSFDAWLEQKPHQRFDMHSDLLHLIHRKNLDRHKLLCYCLRPLSKLRSDEICRFKRPKIIWHSINLSFVSKYKGSKIVCVHSRPDVDCFRSDKFLRHSHFYFPLGHYRLRLQKLSSCQYADFRCRKRTWKRRD